MTLAFENNGVRPYDLRLKGLKPTVVIHDSNGIIFGPGEKGRNAVATAPPKARLYFVEFNAAVAYRSLIGAYRTGSPVRDRSRAACRPTAMST